MIYQGSLTVRFKDITEYRNNDYINITEVKGDLLIDYAASLPNLVKVSGDIDIYAKAELPALTSVGGDIYSYVTISLPKLSKVEGSIRTMHNVNLFAPKLKVA